MLAILDFDERHWWVVDTGGDMMAMIDAGCTSHQQFRMIDIPFGLSTFFACARFSGPPNITNKYRQALLFVPAVASRNAK
jgi:hypothetical protein